MTKRSRFPHRVRLVRNPDVWVVLATFRHFWPNGDSCTVHYAGGDTRRSAIWRALREFAS